MRKLVMIFIVAGCISSAFGQYSEDFESYSCNRGNLECWGFSGTSLSPANAIAGCSFRSGQLNNPSANTLIRTPAIEFFGAVTITFDNLVTSTSSSPTLTLTATHTTTNVVTNLLTKTFTTTSLANESISITLNGPQRLEWSLSGNGGNSRYILDNINIAANATLAETLVGGSCTIVLPVELAAFDGQQDGADIVLSWQTFSETDNDKFQVERSLNGIEYSMIGEVAGFGTTEEAQEYSFTDLNITPLGGRFFYRLLQLDFDGTSTYSDVITIDVVTAQSPASLVMNPIPQGQSALVRGEDITSIDIFTNVGQLVQSLRFDRPRRTVSIKELPQGFYFLKVNGGTTLKLTVQ